MNVIETYDHVLREKLLYNFKKKRISTWIVAWTNNFMQNKRINLIVKTRQTIMNNVNVEISQKSSMSLILYLFYNANLLKLFEQSSRKMIVIDFVTTLTFSFTTLTRLAIANCWRKCMIIVCCEVVVMKSSLRRLNMNWYIWRETSRNSTCKRW
jgi:NhaP-type Na+/H+ and K+/H+ antiporter